jgi:hypothetical protein
MAFRAGEVAQSGYQIAENYLLQGIRGNDLEYQKSKEFLEDLVLELGPVISTYPSWHPLVSNHQDPKFPSIAPGSDCGYKGLDHTVHFVNGFITCPYHDGQKIIDSVRNLPYHSAACIDATPLDVKLYQMNANPVLVKCEWLDKFQGAGSTIPLRVALPLILMEEIPGWADAELAETWESMKTYFLGQPHGARSSLFLDQESGQSVKKIWNQLINTGMFGPIKVGG